MVFIFRLLGEVPEKMKNDHSGAPDNCMAFADGYTYQETEPTGTKHKTRASVRLTEKAHLALLDMADADEVSMKHIGSKAILSLESAGKQLEELRSEVQKSKQLSVLYTLLVAFCALVIGVIVGVCV